MKTKSLFLSVLMLATSPVAFAATQTCSGAGGSLVGGVCTFNSLPGPLSYPNTATDVNLSRSQYEITSSGSTTTITGPVDNLTISDASSIVVISSYTGGNLQHELTMSGNNEIRGDVDFGDSFTGTGTQNLRLENNAILDGNFTSETADPSTVDTNRGTYVDLYDNSQITGNITTADKAYDQITILGTSVVGGDITTGDEVEGVWPHDGDNILLADSSVVKGNIYMGAGYDILSINPLATIEGTADGGDGDNDEIETFSRAEMLDNYKNFEYLIYYYSKPGYLDSSNLDLGGSYTTPSESIDISFINSNVIMTGGGVGEYTFNSGVTADGDTVFDFMDGAVGDHLILTSGSKSTGSMALDSTLLKFDTDFANKTSDYITVAGQLTGNGIVYINDITSATYDDYNNTTQGEAEAQSAQNGTILLIDAPNDTTQDENYVFETTQQHGGTNLALFTGSPFVWELYRASNQWVMGYYSDTRATYVEPSCEDDGTCPPPPPPPSEPKIAAEAVAYASLPAVSKEMARSDTLHERLGELRNNQGWVGTGSSNLKTNLGTKWHNTIGFNESRANAWIKGNINHFGYDKDAGFDVSGTFGGVEIGIDKKFDLPAASPQWSVFTGVFGGYKTGDFSTSGEGDKYSSNLGADIDVDMWELGAYATFFNTAGTYIDIVGKYMDFDTSIDADPTSSSTDGYGLSASVEVGHSFDLRKAWIIEPQAQLEYAYIKWDDLFTGVNNVEFDTYNFLTGRVGVRVEKTILTSAGEVKPWGYIGVVHEFSDTPQITYAGLELDGPELDTSGEIKLGITADVYRSVQLYSDVAYTTDFSDYDAVRGNLGVRVEW